LVYDKNNPLHVNPRKNPPPGVRIGKALSCWEDDMEGKYGIEFVGAGAKSYALVLNDGTIKMKQKGITMDVANIEKITYDRFKGMALNNKDMPSEIESVERFQFSWESGSSGYREIVTKFIKKSIKSTVKDKRDIHGYDTLPFGYNMQLVN
jgi:hypothetical protein